MRDRQLENRMKAIRDHVNEMFTQDLARTHPQVRNILDQVGEVLQHLAVRHEQLEDRVIALERGSGDRPQ